LKIEKKGHRETGELTLSKDQRKIWWVSLKKLECEEGALHKVHANLPSSIVFSSYIHDVIATYSKFNSINIFFLTKIKGWK